MPKKPDSLPRHVEESLRPLVLGFLGTDTLDMYELSLFDWYMKETEGVVENILSEENQYIEKQVKRGTSDLNDSGVIAVNYYTKRLRYSHVIYLTSLLETCLRRSCDDLEALLGSENIPFGLDQIRGNQWSTKEKYLEAYGGFELPAGPQSILRKLILVRNCVVHDNGDTTGYKESRIKELRDLPGIEIINGELAVEHEYVRTASDALRTFVEAVEAEFRRVRDGVIKKGAD